MTSSQVRCPIANLNLGRWWSGFISLTGAEQERKSWAYSDADRYAQSMEIEWDPNQSIVCNPG